MAAYRMDKEGSGCSNAAAIHLQDATLNNHAAISFTVAQGTNNLVGQSLQTPMDPQPITEKETHHPSLVANLGQIISLLSNKWE